MLKAAHAALAAAILCALTLALGAYPARAAEGPPPKGWYGTIPGLYLFCQYEGGKPFITGLADRVKAEGKAGFTAGMEAAAKSGKCRLWQNPTVAVGESESLGIGAFNDMSWDMYVVHVGDANNNGYILYDRLRKKLDPATYGVGA